MKKAEQILDRLTCVVSAAVCAYYAVYLLFCIVGFDSRLMCLFALFVIACAGLPVLLRDKLESKLGKAFKPLQIAFTSLLSLYLVSLVFFWCYIGFDAAKKPESYAVTASTAGDTGADTIVMVFGCRTYGYTPSDTLRLRLDAALELLNALPDAQCMVSGGQGSNETVPEAESMRAYLVFHGIAEERVIMEDQSHSTSENVRFTKELLESLGLTDKKIIGVSTAFHLPRIEALSERYELPMEVCASPSPSFALYYVSMVREYLSYIKMLLFDQAVIITHVT
ncbi:MAG: YdcF family protein [Clostridia bacterium]|nr:YdcF family protein [Clostridia bacterium]